MPVLVVEDDLNLADALVRELKKQGLTADAVHDGEAAIEKIRGTNYTVVLLDLVIPKVSGIQVVDYLKNHPRRPAVIAMTGADANLFGQVDRTVVRTILFKPLDLAQVAAYVAATRSGLHH